ncbi:membrane protein [Defluviimonas sp. 20V17]|uniref:EamA-like transporter family protein n=1 Tax=Allgaiera indica TaxID=765699 RepID=A0AAN4UT11_9RHOB|nr:DMT family transporter [Allgaiera indica]KDB01652.1 membrane protein [Defluviimonas sp. 20V17]GHE03934.1 permease [Allgaiera indica]SDX35428.1 EamA-like transporter family protein [Allgaiera indica]
MTRHPQFGIFLGLFGALAITPDTLLMRWSAMGGAEMTAWRGLLMGATLLSAWLIFRRRHLRGDLRAIACGAGMLVVVCQFFNLSLFAIGIAVAPVPVVLFSVATTPIFSALLSRMLLGEGTHWSTWATIVAVLAGIGIAVFGASPGGAGGSPLLGAAAGLGVALSLALSFVTIRRRTQLPILLMVAVGAMLAGLFSLAWIGPRAMAGGHLWAIALSGGLILPVSFFSLSLAPRYTQASNVSLLLLLETILGPIWVWAGIGVAPTPAMLAGGAIVIGSLAVYLWYAAQRQTRVRGLAPSSEPSSGASLDDEGRVSPSTPTPAMAPGSVTQ